MQIERRQFLVLTAAGLLPTRLWAATEVRLGNGTLTSLSDGHLVLPEGLVIGGMPEEEARAILSAAEAAGAPTSKPPCNISLWQTGDATVLFDAGSGSTFMETAGKLPEALAAAGMEPAHVTHLVFTHGHPDHLWGALDDFDEPLFANAQHLMGAEEYAYWTDPATLDAVEAERQSFVVGAARRLDILGDRVALFSDGDEVAPGVRAVATFGHTPGHMSFDLGEALVVGDAIGNGHVAFARPDWPAPADHLPEVGIETRVALLDRLAESGTPFLGFHLPDGGLGTAERDGEGYRFVSAV